LSTTVLLTLRRWREGDEEIVDHGSQVAEVDFAFPITVCLSNARRWREADEEVVDQGGQVTNINDAVC